MLLGHLRKRLQNSGAERRRAEGNVQWHKKLKLPCKWITWPISSSLFILISSSKVYQITLFITFLKHKFLDHYENEMSR